MHLGGLQRLLRVRPVGTGRIASAAIPLTAAAAAAAAARAASIAVLSASAASASASVASAPAPVSPIRDYDRSSSGGDDKGGPNPQLHL